MQRYMNDGMWARDCEMPRRQAQIVKFMHCSHFVRTPQKFERFEKKKTKRIVHSTNLGSPVCSD